MKYKVAAEVAEKEFERLCDANRVDYDTSELTEEEAKDWAETRASIVRLIKLGTLTVSEEGRAVYTPAGSSKSITFHRPTGATMIAGDGLKGKDIQQTLTVVADMTRTPVNEFGKMDAIDAKACMRIGNLFLAQG